MPSKAPRKKAYPLDLSRPKPKPPHVATKETRDKVRLWAQVGTEKHVIAHEIGISVQQLTYHYGWELEEAEANAIANVAATVYAKALKGDLAAAMFFLKSRGKHLGWTDKAAEVNISVTAGSDTVRDITAALMSYKIAHPSTDAALLVEGDYTEVEPVVEAGDEEGADLL